MGSNIKVGFCVAYDWPLLQHALPRVYDAADSICLSMDRSRVSWSGNTFAFDELAFRRFLGEIDIRHKIRIYEDDFFVSNFTPMQNEVRQRNLMAEFMQPGGWHIQLDCDEYFLDFAQFVKYLKSIPRKSYKFNVCCSWITLFKRIDEGFLYVVPDSVQGLEYVQIATLSPAYEYGRRNGDFNFYTNFKIVHQSWARSDAEVAQKIFNWAHINDFDGAVFLQKWRHLSSDNYHSFTKFHPIDPVRWPSLAMLRGNSIPHLFLNLKLVQFPGYSTLRLVLRNSRTLSRIRALWRKVM